ncbi:MAG: cupin domain-containing protein [Candidatus Binatia bacterium]
MTHTAGMRSGMVLALVCAAACTERHAPQVLLAGVPHDLDDLVRRYPVAATASVRVDEIGRTPGTSVHLVQLRGGEAPHRHAAHDLAVTVVRGAGLLHVADAEQAMRAGDVAIVPRGVIHWYTNAGDVPSVTLAIFSPPLDAPDSIPVDDVDRSGDAR